MRFNLRPRKWMTSVINRLTPEAVRSDSRAETDVRQSSPKSSRRVSRRIKIMKQGKSDDTKHVLTKTSKLNQLSSP